MQLYNLSRPVVLGPPSREVLAARVARLEAEYRRWQRETNHRMRHPGACDLRLIHYARERRKSARRKFETARRDFIFVYPNQEWQ